jgi:murein L,D-transpeptidase YafK
LEYGAPVFIRAFKRERELELFVHDRRNRKFVLFRSYRIAALSGGPGPKTAEGDCQVPEGFYAVAPSAMKADSRYHLAFNIGYPNAYDRHHGRTGSLIMVHGNQVSIGCLAMTDVKIEEIFSLCAAAHARGQERFQVHIFPFRMSDAQLARAHDAQWSAFWSNLKQGYDHFEATRIPPAVSVRGGRYHFDP